jgi:hypothetical protein
MAKSVLLFGLAANPCRTSFSAKAIGASKTNPLPRPYEFSSSISCFPQARTACASGNSGLYCLPKITAVSRRNSWPL